MERFIWQDIIRTNIFCLRIAGLWPDKEFYQSDLYTFYSMISVFFFVTLHVLFQTVNVIFVYSNLEALTETILVCVAELLAIFKIFTFMRNIRLLKSLMLTLESDLFQPKTRDQIFLIQPDIQLWKMIYQTLLGAVGSAVLLWLLFPVINGSVKTFTLPFPAWYPYDIEQPINYTLTYLHQVLGTSLLALGDYNIDMLISALMMYVGAQCDILCDDLKNLGIKTYNFKKMLKECVVHHRMILRFAENCNDFFNFMMLGQFFTSSVCMAMALFRLALVTPSSFEFYTLLCSIMSMIMQIFTYCWFGEEVESKSDNIMYAAFESSWVRQRLSEKRSLIIFTQRTQNSIKLSTFKLFYLSLQTFVKILRSAFSYYTVLLQFSSTK